MEEDRQSSSQIDEIDPEWDPLVAFADDIAGTILEHPLDMEALGIEPGEHDPATLQHLLEQGILALQNHPGAIINSEVDIGLFLDEEAVNFALTLTAVQALPGEVNNETQGAGEEVAGVQGQNDSPTSPASSKTEAGDDDDTLSSGTLDHAMPDDMSLASWQGPRTGTMSKYIAEVGTYGPDDKSRTQVILHFSAPSKQMVMAFNADRYDCDALTIEVHKYDGVLDRYSHEIGNESCSVDVDISDFGKVDDIRTVGVYLSKAGDVAALIMSYVFDDDHDQVVH